MESKMVDESDIMELDTKFSSRRVWLVKIPQFVAQHWSSLPPNSELGKVIIKEKKGQNAEMSIALNVDPTPDVPREYDLLYSPAASQIQIFSEQDKQVAMEGTVEHKCDMKPMVTEEYRRLCKTRLDKSMTKTRVLKTIENVGGFSREPSSFVNAAKKRKPEEKRERMEKEELIDLIFSTFEKGTYFDIKTLAAITNQPMVYLKEILLELCIYNKRGPHKGMYELKPQYKGRTSNQVTSATPMQT